MIKVVHMYANVNGEDGTVVDTCSRTGWERGLSPFIIGPCNLYQRNGEMQVALNMENAWQYAKVYKHHTDEKGDPTSKYWGWAQEGWRDSRAHRYPMGKGAIPEYSFWNGEKLGYVDARKQIYVPLYAEAVQRTDAFQRLKELHAEGDLILRDWDGYDHRAKGMITLTEVLNNPNRKMGHAFVLMMLLSNDNALKQCAMREQKEEIE